MKTQFIKQISAYKVHLKSINAMAGVKSGYSLIRIAVMLIPVTGVRSTRAKVKCIIVFLRHIYFMFKHNGAKGACLRLKVYAVTLQQSIGGHKVKDLTELKFRVARTNRGLPRVIPVQMRNAIRAGDPAVIRFYLTLFNLFRMIDFKGDFRISSLTKTIVSPAKEDKLRIGTLRFDLLAYLPNFFKLLTTQTGLNSKSLRRELLTAHEEATAFPLLKSSPFTKGTQHFEDLTKAEREEIMVREPCVSTHPLAIHEAASALWNHDVLREAISYFLYLLPQGNPLRMAYHACITFPIRSGVQPIRSAVLGKLSLKEESAGKVRVFAIVDPWTQWLLKPLHDTIFDQILAGIPQDGTRDQMAPVYTLLKSKPRSLFSLDLSAATDRLPLWLQEAILGQFAGDVYATMWKDLLVGREYLLTTKDVRDSNNLVKTKVKYAVGQPMGALSSWAMLALTHHYIVQFAHYKATQQQRWFTGYAVLGDDIVIADPLVAKQYLQIMQTLGVGIGLHKSLISGSGKALEFAKRTIFNGTDVSPVTLTELQASFMSPASAVGFIKKYALTLSQYLKMAGYGYKVLGGLHKPLGKLSAKVRLIVLALNIPTSVEEVKAFFQLGAPKSKKAHYETEGVISLLIDKELPKIKGALNRLRTSAHSLEGHVLHAKDIAAVLLERASPLVVLSKEDQELLLDAFNDVEKLLGPDGSTTFASEIEIHSMIKNLRQLVTGQKIRILPFESSSKGYIEGLFEALQNLQEALENSGKDQVETGELAEMNYAVTHSAYLRTLERLLRAQYQKPALQLVKYLQWMVQGSAHTRILVASQAISDSLVKLQLGKWEIPMDEMFMGLISISRDIGSLPLASVKYTRVIDTERKSFTDGTLIRLWKALSGVAQGTIKVESKKEFTGWW